MTWTARFASLSTPVDVASLAAFRILFGLLMAFAMIRFVANGWVDELYVKPAFYFSYELFPWVKPLPSAVMHALFVALAALAMGLALGFCYRLSAALFLLGFTYVELIDKTTYLNHYYFVSLLIGLMIFVPAHRTWSLDSRLRPVLRADFAPGWTLGILRFQIAVVYLFAGLAKLNSDWLLEAQPMRIWLAARSDLPLVGPMLDERWVAYAASWVGAAYDLTIVFLLWHRRTRPWVFAAVVAFHLVTWILFRIGMFPWLMIASALLFFPPDWPRRWLKSWSMTRDRFAGRSRKNLSRTSASTQSEAEETLPLMKALVERPARELPTSTWSSPRPMMLAALGIYACIQIALPLRHYFQSQSSGWTFQGFNWSWRVMLVEKSGYAEFRAFDPETGRSWRIRATDYLTPRQVQIMVQDPAMIRALAQHIATDLRAQGFARIQIFADAHASLNGRPSQRLIDPSVDLAAPLPTGWIVALRE